MPAAVIEAMQQWQRRSAITDPVYHPPDKIIPNTISVDLV